MKNRSISVGFDQLRERKVSGFQHGHRHLAHKPRNLHPWADQPILATRQLKAAFFTDVSLDLRDGPGHFKDRKIHGNDQTTNGHTQNEKHQQNEKNDMRVITHFVHYSHSYSFECIFNGSNVPVLCFPKKTFNIVITGKKSKIFFSNQGADVLIYGLY